jgi:succinoglycan biosynthesis protein ExoW
MSTPAIAVIVPFFQRKKGLLAISLQSAFSQVFDGNVMCIVIDDESPVSAKEEIADCPDLPRERIVVLTQKNGGAGAARNAGLNAVPADTQYVAFLDSDDSWRPHHLANAVRGLGGGHDAYFSDWWSYNFPDQTNFERIQALDITKHKEVPGAASTYVLGVTPIEHILRDGGGVIQTSTVVYRFEKFKSLRFREEFYNGQDFFFWMDLGERGAQFVFSTDVGCDNGEGINIYQGAGWGTERSLQRLRNELFVWTSVNRFYQLCPAQFANNRRTIRRLQRGVIFDVLYRLRRRMPISTKLIRDIISMDYFVLVAPIPVATELVWKKIFARK